MREGSTDERTREGSVTDAATLSDFHLAPGRTGPLQGLEVGMRGRERVREIHHRQALHYRYLELEVFISLPSTS